MMWLYMSVLGAVLCSQAAAIKYSVREDTAVTADTSRIVGKKISSIRHCSQLCTADPSCFAANYHLSSSQCELLTSHIVQHAELTGSTAIIGQLKVKPEGLVAFWPLTKKFGGQDLMNSSSDIELHGVTFNDNTNTWASPAAGFAGTAGSYGQIFNSPHLKTYGSFSWMAAVYTYGAVTGPVFSVDVGVGHGTHIWLHPSSNFYVAIVPTGSGQQSIGTSSPIDANKWNTVAVAFDLQTMQVSIWVNGFETSQQWVSITGTLYHADEILSLGVRRGQPADTRYFQGRITCMSFYNSVKSYAEMYKSIPLCKIL